jgi:hypothetical protein
LTVFLISVFAIRSRREIPEPELAAPPEPVVLTPEAATAFFETDTGWHPLPNSLTASDSKDRRKASRRPGNFVPIHLSDAQALARPKRAWVLDRSTGGLRIAVDRDLPVGVLITIRAENAPDDTPWVQVQIRSCRPADKHFELGCQFLQTPPWSVLLMFG